MKHFYPLSALSLLFSIQAFSQTSLHFSIKQLPLLVADAGKDTTVIKGQKVTLGGALPATGGSGNYTYLWSPIIGLDKIDIAHPTATADTTIIYTLIIDDGMGCTKTSSVELRVALPTGIPNIDDELGLLITPNPNNGIFYITTKKGMGESTLRIQIFNPLGQLVHSESIDGREKLNKTINLTTGAKGLYLLQLSSSKFKIFRKFFML